MLVAIAIAGWRAWHERTASTEPIKIGVIAPITGPVADYGEESRDGVRAAVTSGRISVLAEDDACDPKKAVSAFQKLTSFQDVHFIVGPGCGSPQEAIVPLLRGQDIIAIVPSAASDALYDASGGNLFNIQYSLEDESAFIATEMADRNITRVALIRYANAFSAAHAASFIKNFPGQIVVNSTLTDVTTDVSAEVVKIAAAKPDAVYAPDISFFFGNGLVKLRQLGFSGPVWGTYVVELPAVRQLVDGIIYSYPADVDSSRAVYDLSRQAATLLSGAAMACDGDYACTKDKLVQSGRFDDRGVYRRSLILKKITGGQPEILN